MNDNRVVSELEIWQYLGKGKPRFILYSSEGYLPGVFHFSCDNLVEERYEFIFSLVYEGGPYKIYKVSYKTGL